MFVTNWHERWLYSFENNFTLQHVFQNSNIMKTVAIISSVFIIAFSALGKDNPEAENSRLPESASASFYTVIESIEADTSDIMEARVHEQIEYSNSIGMIVFASSETELSEEEVEAMIDQSQQIALNIQMSSSAS